MAFFTHTGLHVPEIYEEHRCLRLSAEDVALGSSYYLLCLLRSRDTETISSAYVAEAQTLAVPRQRSSAIYTFEVPSDFIKEGQFAANMAIGGHLYPISQTYRPEEIIAGSYLLARYEEGDAFDQELHAIISASTLPIRKPHED